VAVYVQSGVVNVKVPVNANGITCSGGGDDGNRHSTGGKDRLPQSYISLWSMLICR
jgi:hypothetical protein